MSTNKINANLYDIDLIKILLSLDKESLKLFGKEFFNGIVVFTNDKENIESQIQRWIDIEKKHIDDVFFKLYNIKSSDLKNHDLEYFRNIIENSPYSKQNQDDCSFDMFKNHYEWLINVAPFWINLCDTFNKFGYRIKDFVNEDTHLFFEPRTLYSKKEQNYLQFLKTSLHPLVQYLTENIDKKDIILENIETLKTLNIQKIYFTTASLDSLLYDFRICEYNYEKYFNYNVSDGSYEWIYQHNNFHHRLSNANFTIPVLVFTNAKNAFNSSKFNTIIPISETTTIAIQRDKHPVFSSLVIDPNKLKHFDVVFNAINVPVEVLESMNVNVNRLLHFKDCIIEQKNKIEVLTKESLEVLGLWSELSADNILELDKKKQQYLSVFDTILEEQINTTSGKTGIDLDSIKRMISYEPDDNPPLIPLKKSEGSTVEKPLQKQLIKEKK